MAKQRKTKPEKDPSLRVNDAGQLESDFCYQDGRLVHKVSGLAPAEHAKQQAAARKAAGQ